MSDDIQLAGLTTTQAQARLAQVGFNNPVTTNHTPRVVEFLLFFVNPLILILLAAALVSALLGDSLNAGIIAVVVVLSVTLNFVQTFRSQRVVERLRAQVAPTATVQRDGQWVELAVNLIVPEDLVRLSAGDLVPADAQLVHARDLHVNQATLTGESMPVEKMPNKEGDEARVFLGTSVISGNGIAIVTATGTHTEFGKIAARLAQKAPETDFERGLRQFSWLITRTVFVLVVFVFLVSAALRHDPLEALLFAIALAVGLTPEFLPVINTITLGEGALQMSRQRVIVKHLASIQNLGGMDILCSDKTGTLTSGEMVLEQCIDLAGKSNERIPLFAYLNSVYQSGIPNAMDAAILAHDPSPIEKAEYAKEPAIVEGYEKIDEIPFDFERRRTSVVVAKDGIRWLITKGASENVIPLCTGVECAGTLAPFGEVERTEASALSQREAQLGYRLLAVAYVQVPIQASYAVADEKDLTLLGFLAFADPPLPDVTITLNALKRDGVTIKILTGDSDTVARHVCDSVGIDTARIISGTELDRIDDTALGVVAEQTAVFARVSPMQKNRILLALKRRGHVVGYMGDGINDAPSLHAADVGISVANAVDVAKDAADIILLDRDLQVLHTGILIGRRAFGNVIKYLLMETSSNFGNMFSMAGAALLLPFLPMLPTQILLNNFLYDLAQVTLPGDNVDETFLLKPQRWNVQFIRKFMLSIGPISSLYDFLTFAALLFVFHAGPAEFHTGWFVESLATQTLVIFVIRTAGNPFRSRPSNALIASVFVIVAIAFVLPYTPLAAPLGFVPLPLSYLIFAALATVTYLGVVELAKRRLMPMPR